MNVASAPAEKVAPTNARQRVFEKLATNDGIAWDSKRNKLMLVGKNSFVMRPTTEHPRLKTRSLEHE